ncbi:hypothetical protein [Pedosphaera parvula]|uniref:Uncharacterized protein n=1 Tax=Pedosphaera parvula (strain Ellin514) TaxID=320771 RepID=B9XLI3_PEDPL|nr:hypothetical protein [Pedosphaera parvula]EEF59231.1 hypothetical protein Cflav_PD2082 [Pedosphaera parvula Ellin514]
MKTLLFLFTVVGLVSAAAWQRQSISNLHQEIAQLSHQILETRSALESDQTRLVQFKQRLRQLHAHPISSTPDTTIIADASPLPDPQSEGWWPTNKPYFYLHKDLLKTVRIRDLTSERIDPKPGQPRLRTISNRLFQTNHLNEHMAILLGFTEAEKSSVEQTYDNLTQKVRDLEAANIQRVDPPQTDQSGNVFARIPSLKSEVAPLRKEAHESLESTIGTTRTELLEKQAAIFFNGRGDCLGSVPREFLQNGSALTVRYVYTDGSDASLKSRTYIKVPNRTNQWEYLHLFGPNGPCPFTIK